MAHLFSPLSIARTRLANRVVMAPLPGGYASQDGFIDDALIDYYLARASGGVGLILLEPLRVVPPDADTTLAHLGLYADAFVPRLRRLIHLVHVHNTRLLATLEAPASMADLPAPELRHIAEGFVLAAWRALAAGCDGVLLTAADGGLLHMLFSPLTNNRFDEYGGGGEGRVRLALQIIESIRRWMGTRLLIGVRMIAEEFAHGGSTLQDARVMAGRVVAAGADLLDITADPREEAQVARFPGWSIPLANSIKRYLPDTPIIGSGMLGEPYLADSMVREGSIDLVMLDQELRTNPQWASMARAFLGC